MNGTLEEHIQQVKKVMRKLQEKSLRLKLKKCEFHVKETEFLGFIISTEGIRMDLAKVKVILEWSTPECVKDIQAFTGLTNYY